MSKSYQFTGIFFFFSLLFVSTITQARVIYAAPLRAEDHKIGNMLEWGTASEINSLMFIIERSTDGVKYESAGLIEAAGNSTELRTYRFLDTRSGAKQAYYRLKQVDVDGSFNYSPAIKIRSNFTPHNFTIKSMSEVEVTKALTINLDVQKSGNLTYSVATFTGETQLKGKETVKNGSHTLQIDMEKLPPSVYRVLLTLNNEEEELIIQKVQ
ncbi:MAG: hypothetical protein KA974_09885 [Saprospiraceae bacterium]|nr:hypothetical protein [Saprospiraceae bacterium]MBP7679889.1 hypothetical protein [Saprospiraceae bacterium]